LRTSKDEYKRIRSYLKDVAPQFCDRVEYYRGDIPIFDYYGIEEEIEKAYNRKVWIKKGGYLAIDHTEALVAIDVNTGRYVGGSDQEETALKINLEAAREIARQLRLRDIGGLIVIDFIDMESAENRRKVWEELVRALKRDRSKTSVSQISDFGLVEMTRQRVRPSLLYTFSEPCPVCGGIGRVQGRETTIAKIERWLRRWKASQKEKELVLYTNPVVTEHLLEDDERRLKLLKKSVKLNVEVKADPDLPIDGFVFRSPRTGEDLTSRFTSEGKG